MGKPVPIRQREMASVGCGPLTITMFDTLPEHVKRELVEKYGPVGQTRGEQPMEIMAEKTPVLTRESYLEMKEAGESDSTIRKKFGMNQVEMTNWKRENGLSGYRLPHSREESDQGVAAIKSPEPQAESRPKPEPELQVAKGSELPAEERFVLNVEKTADGPALQQILGSVAVFTSTVAADGEQYRLSVSVQKVGG